jgi:RNA polymerase sigma-70 factor (ECF subfamily)
MTTDAGAASLGGIVLGGNSERPWRREPGSDLRDLDLRNGMAGARIGVGEICERPGGSNAVSTERERRFEALVSEQRDRAIGLAWRMLGGDAAAAEDVAQEAFLRAYRGLASFREDAQLTTWFFRILVNEVQRHRRWRWVRERSAGEMPEEPRDPAARVDSDPMLRARMVRAIDRLSRGQREAFVLVHLEGMTIRETAEVTGRAVGTIKSHLHRALRALRSELADLADRVEQEEGS